MTTHEGLALGHEAAHAAANNAGETWTAQAYSAFVSYALTHLAFTTEEVRLANTDLPEPPDMRAWGAIPRMAKAAGIVTPAGWVRANSRAVHGMVVTLWESTIFEGQP
jgi:Zn-dependent protease with chaperone function